MVEEERTPDTRNGSQTGFYPGGLYHYGKKFFVPEEWEKETVILELEGAYMNARVYVNGDYAGGYPHGYSNFYVCLDHFLKYGQENELKVMVFGKRPLPQCESADWEASPHPDGWPAHNNAGNR